MAEYLIQDTSLTSMADEIRILYGTEDTMTPVIMTENLSNANTEVNTQTDWIEQIMLALGIIKIVMVPSQWIQNDVLTSYSQYNYNARICYNNNLWVAGSYGIYYSTDGKTWTQSNVTSGAFGTPYYANGIWVCGTLGTSNSDDGLYYSTDGKTWTQSNLTSGNFYDFSYANGIWVATSGYNNASSGIYYSTDGMTWTQSNITSNYYEDVCYGNGLWVAVSTGSRNYYSTDGITWTASATLYADSIYYNNELWVAGGNDYNGIYYSTDGKTWTQSNITDKCFKTLYYANGVWVISSIYDDEGLYYSTDGKTWTQSNITSGQFEYIHYANDAWVVSSEENGFYYSADGKTWIQSNVTSQAYSVDYGNGLWVASGYQTLYYSEGIAQKIENEEDNTPSTPTLISFTIDGTEYQAEEGMTWGEWCESEYNIINAYPDGPQDEGDDYKEIYFVKEDGTIFIILAPDGDQSVIVKDIIISNGNYVVISD